MSLLRAPCGLPVSASHKQGGSCLERPVSASTWQAPHRGSWQQGGAGRCGFLCQASTPDNQATLEAGGLVDAQEGADACFGPTEKLCEGCKVVRSLVEFGAITTTLDGHHYFCRACVAERAAARYLDKKDIPHPKGPKRCRRCGLTKAGRDFSKNAATKDGLDTRCRACLAELAEANIASNWARIKLVTSKTCADCGKHKAAADFSKYCLSLDGLRPRCKECDSERQRERRQQRMKATQAPVTTRQCIRCKVLKPASAFGVQTSEDGLAIICKECRRGAMASDPTVESKTCSRCHAEKPAAEFARQKSTKTGLRSACKACTNAPRALRPTVAEKQCAACEATKPASAFHWKVASPDGLYSKCKVCRNMSRHAARKPQGPGSPSERDATA